MHGVRCGSLAALVLAVACGRATSSKGTPGAGGQQPAANGGQGGRGGAVASGNASASGVGNTLGGVGNAAAGEATRGGEGALAAGAAAGLAGAGGEAGVEPGAHPTFTVVAGDPIEPYAQGVALGDLNNASAKNVFLNTTPY
jgi:hypothetical protein